VVFTDHVEFADSLGILSLMRERTEQTETTKDGRTTRFEKSFPGLARVSPQHAQSYSAINFSLDYNHASAALPEGQAGAHVEQGSLDRHRLAHVQRDLLIPVARRGRVSS
jgi:hypothetical protein